MSYDLLAFVPAVVDDADFDTWWAAQEWPGGDTPPSIGEFARQLQQAFPSSDEPGAWEAAEESGDQDRLNHLAEYAFGDGFVYVNFRWSVGDEARTTFLRTAQRCGVAAVLISEGSTILRPVPDQAPGDDVMLVEFLADIPYESAPHPARAMASMLQQRLAQLDGDDFGVYILGVEPGSTGRPGRSGSHPDEYMQSAGAATGMAIEVKRLEADGVLRQYAVGRAEQTPGEATITWAGRKYSQTLPAHELFAVDQALPVYRRWCLDGTIPDGLRLRLLDL